MGWSLALLNKDPFQEILLFIGIDVIAVIVLVIWLIMPLATLLVKVTILRFVVVVPSICLCLVLEGT